MDDIRQTSSCGIKRLLSFALDVLVLLSYSQRSCQLFRWPSFRCSTQQTTCNYFYAHSRWHIKACGVKPDSLENFLCLNWICNRIFGEQELKKQVELARKEAEDILGFIMVDKWVLRPTKPTMNHAQSLKYQHSWRPNETNANASHLNNFPILQSIKIQLIELFCENFLNFPIISFIFRLKASR